MKDTFFILISICLIVFGCTSVNEKKITQSEVFQYIDPSLLEEDINTFQEINNSLTEDSIDSDRGCPGFLLYDSFKPNYTLVIKGEPGLMELEKNYFFTVNDSLYNAWSYNIYIDKYLGKGFQKTYCGDLVLSNPEIPITLKCISGRIKCIKRKVIWDNTKHSIISVELSDAIFESSNKEEQVKPINYVFKNVLISNMGG